MENQHDPEIKLEMDIADFSSKTVKRIDVQNVVSRSGSHKVGVAVVMSFTDGATGTILIRSGAIPVITAQYARPRMAEYLIVEEAEVVQVT